MEQPVPVLEVGGTHVTAAVVSGGRVVTGPLRRHLDAAGTAEALLDAMAAAGRALGATSGPLGVARWGIAMPSPFDYVTGVGRFTGVGKLDALDGVDVGAGLAQRLGTGRPRFLNDADAFGLGEVLVGAGVGHRRVVGLTLGTGVGSAWIADGRPRTGGADVPPEGRVHLLAIDGAPLEDILSRRALRRAYTRATGDDADVAEIAARADAGDPHAATVLRTGFRALGRALDPWLRRFGAEVLVVGGSIAGAWGWVAPALRETTTVPVVAAAHPEDAALLGAAWWVHHA